MSVQFLNMSNFGLLFTICAIICLTWEILAFVFKQNRGLISTWMQKIGFRNPAVALCLGMILGHVWMYFPPTVDQEVVTCPCCTVKLMLKMDNETGKLTAEKVE